MRWIALSEKDSATETLDMRLCNAADQFREESIFRSRMLAIVMESDEYKQFIQMNFSYSARPQANGIVLNSMRLSKPPASIGEKFDRLVEPTLDEAALLPVKFQKLRRTSDLLMPRLLSV